VCRNPRHDGPCTDWCDCERIAHEFPFPTCAARRVAAARSDGSRCRAEQLCRRKVEASVMPRQLPTCLRRCHLWIGRVASGRAEDPHPSDGRRVHCVWIFSVTSAR
jgi:hypothetical protein